MKIKGLRPGAAVVLSVVLAAAVAAAGEVVGVDTLMREAERRRGPAIVEGVVSQVFPDRDLMGLIDAEEFRKCKVVSCASLTLPVRWEGPMPELASTVRVDGEVQKEGVRLLFVARALEVTAPAPESR